MSSDRLGWTLAALLALAWGLGLALPALLQGQLLGHPYTDLYPSVWGLHWFAQQQPALPLNTTQLAWPGGMGFYYSSPLHGWAAWPLLAGGLSLATTWNLTLLAARIAGPLVAFGWLRSEGLKPAGALAGAALFACAPMFQGYAVEGIVEGSDAWTLALWGWLAARRRLVPSGLAFFLVIASSWYLGLAALLVAAVRAREHRVIGLSALGGLLLAIPLWLAFSHAMPAATPLPAELRAAMGAPLAIPVPGLAAGLQPFAITGYLGWLATGLFLLGARERPWLAAGAVACWVLALGVGPWYQLPGLELVRFPYRLVAACLFLGAPVVGLAAQRWRWGGLLAGGILAEGLLLAPVEPLLPGSSAALPAAYSEVAPTALLEVPGPVAMPPGQINRSRPRARYLLYFQAIHGAASPWAPDFNGVAEGAQAPWLDSWRALDPLEQAAAPGGPPDVEALADAGLHQVMLHPGELAGRAELARQALQRAGWRRLAHDEDQELWLPPE